MESLIFQDHHTHTHARTRDVQMYSKLFGKNMRNIDRWFTGWVGAVAPHPFVPTDLIDVIRLLRYSEVLYQILSCWASVGSQANIS